MRRNAGRDVCMNIDASAQCTRLLYQPRELLHPRLAHTIYNRPRPPDRHTRASPPLSSSSARTPRHLLFRVSFSPSGRNHRFSVLALALESRSLWQASSLSLVRSFFATRLPLPVRCTRGTWRVQPCTRHTSPTGRVDDDAPRGDGGCTL